MNKFELFCLIFYVFDTYWDYTRDMDIEKYLSDANPFLFSDINSADPEIYKCFCNTITDEITINNSYSLAEKYVNSLNDDKISKAFYSISIDEWNKGVKDYLSHEHKGQ